MTLNELYTLKGKVSTELEILNVQLQQINAKILELLKKPKEVKEEKKDAE